MTTNPAHCNCCRGILACLFAFLFLPTGLAKDIANSPTTDSQTRGEAIVQELKTHPPNANEERTVRSIAQLRKLGELGAAAASAVPFLLSEDFFLIAGGYTATDKPLRLATIDALVSIGEPAEPAVIKMLSMPKGRNNFDWNDSRFVTAARFREKPGGGRPRPHADGPSLDRD